MKRYSRSNGIMAEAVIIIVSATIDRKLFFLRKSHIKKGNARGVKVTNPLVRKPSDSIMPERMRYNILLELVLLRQNNTERQINIARVFSSIWLTAAQLTDGMAIQNRRGIQPYCDFLKISFQVRTIMIAVIMIVRSE